MKVVIFCQLALLLTTLTLTISALPTSLNFMTNPDNSQDELDLSSAISPPDEDLENSDVFISPEEIDNTHVRVMS